MHDVVIRTIGEDGSPRPGWYRVRPAAAASLREHFVSAGMEALAKLPASSPRRAEVQNWIKRAGDDGVLPAGTYPLGRGKAAMVVEAANATSIADAQARSEIAAAEVRILSPKPRSKAATLADFKRVLREYGR